MADRTIRAILRAEVQGYKAAMMEASRATAAVGTAADRAAQQVVSAKDRQAQAALRVEQAERQLAQVVADGSSSQAQRAAATTGLQSARQDLTTATAGLAEAERTATSAAEAQNSALGRMVTSARENRQEWTQLGTVLLGVGTAITAVGAASLNTGIQYNSLQQNTRTALTTLLGSAEAVNAQMDKFDTFARQSPFSRAVWLQAQQQMLGFGIEASRVIPYLDAIENAVAGVGGSNQDISELTRIFSQVQAASKITAVDLMQFGQRGVDAASLIGSQMGMTGAEIRSQITAGTLDAQTALDALAAGMQDKFGGAADGIKEQYVGALDRVKAVWRDLSAELAEPLVDPEGGGALVDLFNFIADRGRDFQAMPGWFKAGTVTLTALAGAGSLAAGSFLLLAPRLVDTWDALGRMGSAGQAAQSGLIKVKGALPTAARLAGVAAGFLAVTKALDSIANANHNVETSTALMENALNGVGENTIDDVFAMTSGIDGLSDSFTKLTGTDFTNSVNRWASGFNFLGLTDHMRDARDQFDALGQTLAQMDTDVAAAAFDALVQSLGGGQEVYDQLLELMPAYRDALAEQEGAAAAAEGGSSVLTAALEEQAAAAEAAAQAHAELLGSYMDSSAAFIDISGAYQQVIDDNRRLAEETAAATSSAEDSWEDFYDGVSVSIDDYLKKLEEQVAAQQNWESNMLLLSGRVSQGVLDHLASLGPAGAPLVADLVNASEDELARLEAVFGQTGDEATGAFATALAGAGPVLRTIMSTQGAEAAQAAADALASGETTLQDVIDQYDLDFEIDADTGMATSTLNAWTTTNNGKRITVYVDMAGGRTYNYGDLSAQNAMATGGAVRGPGTGTSDSIPALLSNGEHVLTASDVEKAGGQGAIYRMRREIQAGTLQFKLGGAVPRMMATGGAAAQGIAAVVRSAPGVPTLGVAAQAAHMMVLSASGTSGVGPADLDRMADRIAQQMRLAAQGAGFAAAGASYSFTDTALYDQAVVRR